MPHDPAATKGRILDAAFREFAARGVAGARVDHIAALAQANKESLYRYFGSKRELLHRVLDRYLDQQGAALVPDERRLDQYASNLFHFHRRHPELLRLLVWEGMEVDGEGVDAASVSNRQEHYREKLRAITAQQAAGEIDPELDPRLLLVLLISLADHWFVVPQSVRMILGREPTEADLERYEGFLVECCARLLRPPPVEVGKGGPAAATGER